MCYTSVILPALHLFLLLPIKQIIFCFGWFTPTLLDVYQSRSQYLVPAILWRRGSMWTLLSQSHLCLQFESWNSKWLELVALGWMLWENPKGCTDSLFWSLSFSILFDSLNHFSAEWSFHGCFPWGLGTDRRVSWQALPCWSGTDHMLIRELSPGGPIQILSWYDRVLISTASKPQCLGPNLGPWRKRRMVLEGV